MNNEHSRVDAEGAGAPNILGQLRELITDALRYWEFRRLFYNALLAVIVLAHFAAAWPVSRSSVTFDGVLGLFLLAVLANVAYSAVYVADVFIQFSGFRASRARWRWVLLGVGLTFAAVLTHFFSTGVIGTSPHCVKKRGRLQTGGTMDLVMISIVVVLSFLVRFAMEVLAVVVALWIWNRWPALAALPRRTPE